MRHYTEGRHWNDKTKAWEFDKPTESGLSCSETNTISDSEIEELTKHSLYLNKDLTANDFRTIRSLIDHYRANQWRSVEDLPKVYDLDYTDHYKESKKLLLKVKDFKEFQTGRVISSRVDTIWQIDGCHGDFEILGWMQPPQPEKDDD